MIVSGDLHCIVSMRGIWKGMIARCHKPNTACYNHYGGRGITVCDRWLKSFEAFVVDMGVRPSKQMTLDRRDNDKGYCKDNCRWATAIEQAQNTRQSVHITWNGVTKNASEWARDFNINVATFHQRYNQGWGLDKIKNTGVAKTSLEATRKRPNTIYLDYKDKRQCVQDWATELGLPVKTLYARIKMGWNDTAVLEIPINVAPATRLLPYKDPMTGIVREVSMYEVAKLTKQSVQAVKTKLDQNLPLDVIFSNAKRKPPAKFNAVYKGNLTPIKDIAVELGCAYRTLKNFIETGKTVDDFITTSVKPSALAVGR
jgi:hypothetical protein